MYKAAVIGCGKIGSLFADDPKLQGSVYSHAHAYVECPKTNLDAVCDIDFDRAVQCGRRWNATPYKDYREMIDVERPDIVSVCTPDDTHHAIMMNLLTMSHAPIGIILEKPVALNSKDANEILSCVGNIKVLVDYSRRYVSCRMKKYVEEISPLYVNGMYSGDILHTGTHWIDLARFLFGEMEVYPIMQFENGCVGNLIGFPSLPYSIFEMDVIGEKGRIVIMDSGHFVEMYNIDESEYYTGYSTLKLNRVIKNCMKDTTLNAVSDMVRCLDDGVQPICTLVDGVRAIEVAEAMKDAGYR